MEFILHLFLAEILIYKWGLAEMAVKYPQWIKVKVWDLYWISIDIHIL